MDASALIAVLQDAVPGAQFEAAPSIDLQTTMYVTADALPAVAQALRDRGDLGFTLLAELTAVDLWPTEPRFELVYILVSPAQCRSGARRDRLRHLAGGQLARA